MKQLHPWKFLNLAVRIALFLLVLILGTMVALVAGETPGLALADLADVPVQAFSPAAQTSTAYAILNNGAELRGIYRSEDNGRTWQSVGSGPEVPLQTLAAQPGNNQILYAGSAGGPLVATNNVWRSQDGGRTWHNFSLALPASPAGEVPAVTALVTDPNQPELLYAGTEGQGVYRFKTGQVGYELVGGVSLPDGYVKGLVIAPDSRLYALTNGGLYTTTGDAWQKVETLPGTPVSLAVAPSKAQVLYAGDAASGVYHSTDGGRSWQQATDGLGLAPGAALRVTALAVDEEDPQHVVAATAYGLGSRLAAGGLYESRNGADSWTKLADLEELVTQLSYNDGAIYAATASGLKHYGQLPEPNLAGPLTNLDSLTHPTHFQLLILLLTLALAGLILLGGLERMGRRGRYPA